MLADWKCWMQVRIYIGHVSLASFPLYYFIDSCPRRVLIPVSLSPSIVNDLEWEALQAQLPTTPPYVARCIHIAAVYLISGK